MEKKVVISALAALAQETRLDIFRLLVRAGEEGLPAGALGDALGVPSATLSFHLKELKSAGVGEQSARGAVIDLHPRFRGDERSDRIPHRQLLRRRRSRRCRRFRLTRAESR